MTTTLPRDVFIPVPLRWRHVMSGDVFTGHNGALWHVTEVRSTTSALLLVTTESGPHSFQAEVDPDETVSVLVSVIERDAVELTREQLGVQLVQRRAATAIEQALPAPPTSQG